MEIKRNYKLSMSYEEKELLNSWIGSQHGLPKIMQELYKVLQEY